MEVHHPHHLGHKKKIKEYLLEFFMLFFAVTLGFFAENLREDSVERHREREYMQSMHEDLIKDTAELNEAIAYIDMQCKGIDTSLMIFRERTLTHEDEAKLYLVNLRSLGNRGSQLTSRTSSQLKNAGGMRLVKSTAIGNKLAEYWQQYDFSQRYDDIVGDLKMKARDLSYRIFNQFYYENMQNGTAGASVAADAKLMTTDHSILIEYSNRLSHIMNSMRNVERTAYVREMETAKELMKMIEEEYHLEK
jgi:hypothetical protein